MAGFFQRVFHEGRVRLFRLGHVEFALRMQGEADRAEDFGKFTEFACVVGGEDEALGHDGLRKVGSAYFTFSRLGRAGAEEGGTRLPR
ncbi:hypothetical protein LP420_29550 [Massilia sp. B-10]|nr:hypothetical protein LP420_29550 [Massilia sp. B-10]UUZ57511.1 hypothetical protein LP419_29090 [Massilia sp. H-1]